MTVSELGAVVGAYTSDHALGFLGEPTVKIVALNLDLDAHYPYRA